MSTPLTSKVPDPSVARITLGVFGSSFVGQYQAQAVALGGAVDTARERNFNLVAYSGGKLDAISPNHVQRNPVYNLATSATMGALLLFVGTLMDHIDSSQIVDFCD